MRYQVLDHTADLGIDITGSTLKSVYAGAAKALFSVLSDLSAVRANEMMELSVEGLDREDLLVNFLRELLNLWNRNRFLVKSCQILSLAPRRLTARLFGEPYDPVVHRIRREIKAVTYHDVALVPTKRGWKGTFVLDV